VICDFKTTKALRALSFTKGFWFLGFGIWVLEFGFWNLGFGIWVLEFGSWNLDLGIWSLEFGPWVFLFNLIQLILFSSLR
jgi:hypothetical protein